MRVSLSFFWCPPFFRRRLRSFRRVYFHSSERGLVFAFSGLSAMSDLEINLGGSFLEGTLETFQISPTFFSEEAPKWSANCFDRFRASWRFYSLQHTRGSPLLSLGMISLGVSASGIGVVSSTVRPIIWRRFSRALDPKVLPGSRVFPKFSEGLLCNCEQRPRKFHPAFCCSRPDTKEVSLGLFPSLPQAFFCTAVSSCSERRRGKHKGNRRI